MLTPLFGAEDATIPVTRAAAEAAACDMQMEREALPTLLDWEKIAANADELVVYTIALEAIVVMQALQYRDYRLYATAAARDGEGAGRRLLESKEWNEVTLYALLLSYTLLDKYLIEGRELAREVHDGLRIRRIPGWQEYWRAPFTLTGCALWSSIRVGLRWATRPSAGLRTCKTIRLDLSSPCPTSRRRRDRMYPPPSTPSSATRADPAHTIAVGGEAAVRDRVLRVLGRHGPARDEGVRRDAPRGRLPRGLRARGARGGRGRENFPVQEARGGCALDRGQVQVPQGQEHPKAAHGPYER